MSERRKRGKGANIFVWILLGGLIVGLAGFGIGGFTGTVRSIGKVGDRDIPVEQYARALEAELRALSQQAGRAVTMTQARELGIDRQVLDLVITIAALDNETSRLGLSVGDETVRAEIVANPAFRGPDGRFDRNSYDFALQQLGLSPASFDESVRDETARALLELAVVSGIEGSDTYARTLLGWLGEQRSFTWSVIDAARAGPVPDDPGEADLRAFYEDNPDRFTTPATRQITYVWSSPEMMLDRLEIGDDELRRVYEAESARFIRPERRIVDRLVFATRAEADQARARIDAGQESFDNVVTARGLDLEDVDMGDVTRADLPAAVADAVFAAEFTGVVGPVDTALGPALFQINAILDPVTVTFEEAREELLAEYGLDRARRLLADMIDDIDDLLASGATLEDVAAETALELGTIAWYPGATDDIARDDRFRAAARSVRERDFPEVRELSDGGLFALRLDGENAPRLLPFEEQRDVAVAGWREEASRARVLALGEELRSRIAGGEDFEAAGLTAFRAEEFPRDGAIEGAPRDLVERVFEMRPGEAILFPLRASAVLLRLDDVIAFDVDDPDNAELLDAVSAQVGQSKARDLFTLYAGAVTLEAGVSLDQRALNAVHSQFP